MTTPARRTFRFIKLHSVALGVSAAVGFSGGLIGGLWAMKAPIVLTAYENVKLIDVPDDLHLEVSARKEQRSDCVLWAFRAVWPDHAPGSPPVIEPVLSAPFSPMVTPDELFTIKIPLPADVDRQGGGWTYSGQILPVCSGIVQASPLTIPPFHFVVRRGSVSATATPGSKP